MDIAETKKLIDKEIAGKQRMGECKRCGNCCTFNKLWRETKFIDKLMICLIRPNIIISLNKFKNLKCPHLRFDTNPHQAFCANYEKRPQWCKDYPANKGDLIEGCGFHFE